MKKSSKMYSVAPYYIAAIVGVVWAWTVTYKSYIRSCLGIAVCLAAFGVAKRMFPDKEVPYIPEWNELLKELNTLKLKISDMDLRECVSVIIANTEAICKEVGLYPEKKSRVSRFKNSNLPDLIEILERYVSLPSKNTNNIASIKEQINLYVMTMQKIAEQELDALYRNEDISLEVENIALENMLEKTDLMLGGKEL